MQHSANTDFWHEYRRSRRTFATLRTNVFAIENNPQHPSLQFKKLESVTVGNLVGPRHVKLPSPCIKRRHGYLWFWIGDHKTYDT